MQFGLTKLQQEALVVMPRRSGKTWSMAMYCAAMLVVCSGEKKKKWHESVSHPL